MNICVLGDIMLDINYISNTNRKAPEADISIYNILETNYILGGATNVAKNLNNLNNNVELISVIGDDDIGEKIICILDELNIKNKLFIDNNRKTTQKNRIFLDNVLTTRFDIEDIYDIDSQMEQQIYSYITTNTNINAIIISDYDKGVVTDNLCKKLINFANNNNIYTFIDPKLKNYEKYKNCYCIKPNFNEGMIISQSQNISDILKNIKNKINCENIVLSAAEDGLYVNDIYNHITINNNIQMIDVTGAGDIVICVLVYIFLQNNDLLLAAKIANYIAGKSIQVIGNYNVSINDINEYYELNNYSHKLIYDYDIEKIKKITQSNNNIVFTNGCFDILHSAHIKLLKFSKKQGEILVVGLNSDDSIKRLKGLSRPINNIIERTEILLQFDFIDYIIIFEDDTPLNILKILQPNTIVKGGDYTKEQIIGAQYANNIILFDFIKNKSSSLVINKITQQYSNL